VSRPARCNPLNSAVSLNNISIISSFLTENISSPLQIQADQIVSVHMTITLQSPGAQSLFDHSVSARDGFLWEEAQCLLRTDGAHKYILKLIGYSKNR